MAGQEKRHNLVAYLQLVHRLAILIAGQQKHREEISLVDTGAAMFIDHAVGHLIELCARTAQTCIDREWQALDKLAPAREADLPERLHRGIQGLVKGISLRSEISIKKCATYDHQGQLQHLLRHIDLRAILPGLRLLPGGLDHRGGIAGDALAMKGGLNQAPLLLMGWPIVGNQSPAQHAVESHHALALAEVFMLHDQQFANIVGMIEKEHVFPTYLAVDNITVGLLQMREQF